MSLDAMERRIVAPLPNRACVEPPHLQAGDVHVVWFDLDRPCRGTTQLLDREERARAARFVFDRDRRRFVAAHEWLRVVLGLFLRKAPESLRFTTNLRGKPRLVDTAVDLRFNLSHSGERGALAVTLDQEVGIDIEEARPIEVCELADRFFSRLEVEGLRRLPPPEREAAFFRCWTRKESFIKALGDGLSFPLDGFEVSVEDDRSKQLLRGCVAAPEALSRWRVVSLSSDPPYVAALTAGPGDWEIVTWKATPDTLLARI